MTEPKPQQSESRERIMSVAYGLFVERGFSEVSMQQIGDGAGITKATLYHHFRDKQELFLETARGAFTRGEKAIRTELVEGRSFRDQLRGVLTYISGNHRADLQRLAEDFNLHMDEEMQLTFWEQFERPWHLLRPAVEHAIANGELRAQDPTFVARYIYSVCAGIMQIRRVDPDIPYSNEEMIDLAVSSIMDGVQAR